MAEFGRAAVERQHPKSKQVSGRKAEVVRVSLLGRFEVSVGSRVIRENEWRLKKAASLIKLLSLAPGHRLHRERAMDLLWPELGLEAAANNLHQALHVVRRALEPAKASASRYLHLRGEQILLCPDSALWVDVEAFEDAAAAARGSRDPASYRAALDLYAGDLLPSDRYEGWAEDRREELRRTYLSLLLRLAGLHKERGELATAVETFRKVIAAEPTHEEAHTGLMRLYAEGGQRYQALRQYERLRESLSQELGVEPGGAARRLYEEVATGNIPSAEPPPAVSPPVMRSDAGEHNLPVSLSSFVGREREVAEVEQLLGAVRLLTLTGTGGSGKTRLALEVARDLVEIYPDGAWLVELAPLSEGALVPQAVAAALGAREQPGHTLTDTLTDLLRFKRLLLVLDNCEHLIDACAGFVNRMLASCPHLRVLATSRQVLGVAGEASWRVPSLSLPDVGHLPSVEGLARYEAVRLFVERARSRLPAFALTRHNAPAVAEVCRRLNGIPLAIELATARVTVLAVEQIAERLEDPLDLLTAGDRTAAPRHQTLRAALEWGYDLLGEQERKLFGRLSVFAGGWSLEAAEAVGAEPGAEPGGGAVVLDLLSSLVDKSLVVAEVGPEGAGRYRMLEPVRQYGRERLAAAETASCPGEAGTAASRHAAFFLDLAERAAPELKGPRQIPWLQRLDAEQDNLRAAMAWLLGRGEPASAARLGWALWLFWWIRGRFAEGRRWMEEALSRCTAATPATVRARALFVAGTMADGQADYGSAASLLEESLGLFRELGDKRGAAYALSSAGFAALGQGEHERGIASLEEGADLCLEVGDNWGAAFMLCFLATVRRDQGDHARAEGLAERGLALSREVGDREGTSMALYILAGLAQASGDHERARELFEEGLGLSAEVGDETNVAYCLEGLATVAASEGRMARATHLWGAAEALLERIEAAAYVYAPDRSLQESQVAAVRAELGAEAFAAIRAKGRAMATGQAVEYALSREETVPAPPEYSPPTLPPDPGRGHNLPTPLTSFVGREKELLEVKQTLSVARLLTLTGTGGSGKTRLALEVARDLAEVYPDGVWLVELAPLSQGTLVPQAVAGALGVDERPDRPLVDTLVEALREKEMLLVLDNCEHLVDACARLAETLLQTCPGLRILATSREVLGAAGEVVRLVPPLSLFPEDPRGQGPAPEELEGYESIRLFVERARHRNPAFALTSQNAGAVVEICRRLDGIPLAIELAAARVGISTEQIAARLDDSLRLLTAGGRTATSRQQTLRGALDWSYELLSEPERLLFARLSVFAGGWTLEAAEVVGAEPGSGTEEADVLDLLSRLVDKSLVAAEATGGSAGGVRYRLLEPVRQYALEKLESATETATRPGEAGAVRQRHAAFFLALAERAEPELAGPRQLVWLERLEVEHDNFRAALSHLLEAGDADMALRLGGVLGQFWHMRGHLSEGRRWLEAALEGRDGPETTRIKALSRAAYIEWEGGEYERSISLSEENLALARRARDKAGAAAALYNLGNIELHRNEHEKARALLEEAVALQRELGDEAGLARTLQCLGLTTMVRGDFGRAEALYREGLALARKASDMPTAELLLLGLAFAALGRDEYGRAREICAEALELSRRMDYKHSTAAGLHVLASAAGSEGQPVRAARLWGAAEALREAIGAHLSPVERAFFARHVAAARNELDEAAWEAAWAEGRRMTPEGAVEYGLPAEEPALPAASGGAARSGPEERPASRDAASARFKALAWAGWIAWEQGEDLERAAAFGEEGLALARDSGDEAGVASALLNLGVTTLRQNRLEKAQALLEESLALRRELGDTAGVARSLQALGMAEVARQNHESAQAVFEEGLALARELGDQMGIVLLLGLGALAALGRDDYEQAKELYAQGLETSHRLGLKHGVVFHLHVSASLAGAREQPVRSARLWGAAEALREELGVAFTPVDRHHYGPYIAAARELLDDAGWEAVWAEGRALSPVEAIEYALSEEEPTPPAAPASGESSTGEAPVALTRREEEVAALVARGLTNRQIASELTVSLRTVDSHVARIFGKLGVRSRREVAVRLQEERSPGTDPA